MIDKKEPKTAALTKRQSEMEAYVEKINIVDHASLAVAVQAKKGVKGYMKDVHEYWDPLCDAAHKSWKALTARRKEFLDPADNANAAIDKKIDVYERQQAKIRAAEKAEREKELREAAEKQRLAEVEALRDAGALDEAETIATQPISVPAVVEAPKEKIEGFSTSTRWFAEVTNLGDFLSFLAGEPRFHYLIKDFPMKELNKLAVAQKEMFDIPGVEAKYKISSSTRT